jgi:hypothetical protein
MRKLIDFDHAILAALNGQWIKRRGWAAYHLLYVVQVDLKGRTIGKLYLAVVYHGKVGKRPNFAYDYHPDSDDKRAKDWIVIEGHH